MKMNVNWTQKNRCTHHWRRRWFYTGCCLCWSLYLPLGGWPGSDRSCRCWFWHGHTCWLAVGQQDRELRKAAAWLLFRISINSSHGVWHLKCIWMGLMANLCIVVIHREIADQPGVWVILIVGQNLSHGRQVQHVPLRCRPHPLQHRFIFFLSFQIQQNNKKRWLKQADPFHCQIRCGDFVCDLAAYLVRLINNCCIVWQCLHNIEVFNGG